MDKIKGLFTNLQDKSADYSKEEIDNGKLMALLSYIGILALIPYFAEKENKYVRFHAIQGLNLLIVNLISSPSFPVKVTSSYLTDTLSILITLLSGSVILSISLPSSRVTFVKNPS